MVSEKLIDNILPNTGLCGGPVANGVRELAKYWDHIYIAKALERHRVKFSPYDIQDHPFLPWKKLLGLCFHHLMT